MSQESNQRVCPVEYAGGLDNKFRRFLQNPVKILKPYIKEGMTVLDVGCGPGFFTLDIAKMLNKSGKVIAADLQQGMLDRIVKKISGTELEQRIHLYKCEKDSLGLTDRVDFILAFYMIHEVADQKKLFKELADILKPEGKILIIEPKFHVSEKAFKEMADKLTNIGLVAVEQPKVFFSRSIVLQNPKS